MRSQSLFKTKHEKLQESEKHTSECRLALLNMCGGLLEVNGRKIELGYETEIAHGGFKIIYDISDGKVLALRNSNDGFSKSTVINWEYATIHETHMSAKLHKLGLEAQDYQRVEVKINGHIVPALMMTHFKELLHRGLQIRGSADSEKFGTSMIFGEIENVNNDSYLRELFKCLITDIVTLISNKIDLSMDSLDTLVIKNTDKKINNDVNCCGTVVDRKQELHFYLLDFFEKHRFFQRDELNIFDDKFNPNTDEIRRAAKFYLMMSHSAILSGVTNDEAKKMGLSSRHHVSNLSDDVFERIEVDLIKEICDGVFQHLKNEKLTQFDSDNKLKRSLSNLSYFYNSESDEDEIDNELTCCDTGLRNSSG